MARIVSSRLITVIAVVAIALSLTSGWRVAEAGTPTPTTEPTATSTVAATATATPAVTATATPATGSATATPGTATATARLPAAAPQTGADPGSGSDTLTLALLIGAVTVLGASGVFAGYALVRRIS